MNIEYRDIQSHKTLWDRNAPCPQNGETIHVMKYIIVKVDPGIPGTPFSWSLGWDDFPKFQDSHALHDL